MELLTNLGIDYRLLIAQLINFVILLAVLYRFLYKPVLKLLHERSAKIEQGLKNAEEVDIKLKETAALYEQKTIEAKSAAQGIVEASRKEAEKLKAELTAQAHLEAEKIIDAGRQRLVADKERIMKEAEMELGDLVAQATEHVLGHALTPEMDKKLIDEAMKKVRIGRA